MNERGCLLGILFILKLLDLASLTFDLALLRRNLRLRPLLRFFVILQSMADCVAANAADTNPNQGSGHRMTHCGSYNCTAASAQDGTDTGCLLGRRELLALAP